MTAWSVVRSIPGLEVQESWRRAWIQAWSSRSGQVREAMSATASNLSFASQSARWIRTFSGLARWSYPGLTGLQSVRSPLAGTGSPDCPVTRISSSDGNSSVCPWNPVKSTGGGCWAIMRLKVAILSSSSPSCFAWTAPFSHGFEAIPQCFSAFCHSYMVLHDRSGLHRSGSGSGGNIGWSWARGSPCLPCPPRLRSQLSLPDLLVLPLGQHCLFSPACRQSWPPSSGLCGPW